MTAISAFGVRWTRRTFGPWSDGEGCQGKRRTRDLLKKSAHVTSPPAEQNQGIPIARHKKNMIRKEW
jgi:hypothetical protein